MKLKVKKVQASFEIDSKNLFELLSKEIVKKEKEDHIEMSKVLLDYMQITKALSSIGLGQLVTLAFTLGYFYRIFFEKNNVEIMDEKNEIDNSNNEK